jgi:CDP-diacylglycerol--serine O-phosphatidyltransferase
MSHFDLGRAKGKPHLRLRRGMYLLPSLFTAGSLAAGYFSITQTLAALDGSGEAHMHLDWAAIAILLAVPFDALDGRIARMTNTASDFGRELDSLADLVTFGVAPSLLAFVWGFHFLPDSTNPQLRLHLIQAGIFICFLFLLGGASRLARFNISPDAQPRNPGRPDRKYFVGMPIPAAAGLLAATVHFFNGYPVEERWVAVPWLLLVGLCSFLMVSTWRFWSAKEINFSRRHPFQLLVLLAVIAYIVLRYSSVVMFPAALVYMFSGIWARAAYGWSRRRRRRPATLPVSSAPTEPESLGHRFSD